MELKRGTWKKNGMFSQNKLKTSDTWSELNRKNTAKWFIFSCNRAVFHSLGGRSKVMFVILDAIKQKETKLAKTPLGTPKLNPPDSSSFVP